MTCLIFMLSIYSYRLLDFWVSSVRAKEDQLSRYYEPDAILLHSNTVLKAKYDSLILSVQPLATLPFQLHSEFIRDKALMDSKMKSQEMANSKDELVASTNQIQGNNSLNEPITESVPTEVTSVLELTATKALNWITKTALPKLSPHEYSPSKSKSLPLELSSHVTDSPTNEMADSFNRIQRETKSLNDIEKLMEKHKNVYCDAKSSRIDSDHIISPSESMRSSLGSQYGPLSFFSNFTSRFDTSKTENTDNQSILSPSMTSSVTSLVNKFFQFGANLSQRQAYRKGVTEYNFEDQSEIPEEKPGSSEKVENEKDSDDADQILKEKIISDPVVDLTENQSVPKTDTKEDNKSGHKSKVPSPSKRAGFDIVNLFDKLLLPSTKDSGVKPVKESKSRWSWGLGSKQDVNKAKVKKLPKSKIPVTLNRNQSAKSTDTTSKNSSCKMAAGVTPPPKPPRLIPEDSKSGKGNTRGVTQSSSPTSETNYDVGSNSASV